MTFKHGITASQVKTALSIPRQVSASLPVVIGCAPTHRLNAAVKQDAVVMCFNYAEAQKALGFRETDDFEKWGLSEFAYSQFILYGMAPVIFINLFKPEEHRAAVSNESVSIIDGKGKLKYSDVISFTDLNSGTNGVDYSVDLITGTILIVDDGALKDETSVQISYVYATPEAVTSTECIGGADFETGRATGLQLVDEVFTRFRVVPGLLLAPGFSDNPSVAAIMATKAGAINGIFSSVALADLPVKDLRNYTKIPEYKINNNLVQEDLYLFWPRVLFDGRLMRLATHAAGVIATTDADNDDIPYQSPSNHSLLIQGAALGLDDKDTIWLTQPQANYLNQNGITTALNFVGGWKLWGNRTACYPDNNDIKDTFITNRRMFGWYGNNFILTWWSDIDTAFNRRLITRIINTENIKLNSWAAKQYILGGRLEFRDDENSTLDLMDGHSNFHLMWGTASPNESMNVAMEYDPSYIKTLFS
ncbi:phage tail sheath family protein [Budviciaceae bacterium CWB-B4]|uniref:Phage tail sheath family protein n=1 Tax=Limnobaculum xujianqingii TaxID=2738837 RepID=A0A9D7AIC6_9GAMM|nr:hypothetical protein [Limnobaculum xujianqingii]MBK5073227.1 phage tail sheath family protein [Limnobaculum xujianqingii]MBK5176536.1 phage tail sheath family protein [Limnobaculum xujianqingii]